MDLDLCQIKLRLKALSGRTLVYTEGMLKERNPSIIQTKICEPNPSRNKGYKPHKAVTILKKGCIEVKPYRHRKTEVINPKV